MKIDFKELKNMSLDSLLKLRSYYDTMSYFDLQWSDKDTSMYKKIIRRIDNALKQKSNENN